MNKDLMMKAAVQFKGVWPNDDPDLGMFGYLAICIKEVGEYKRGDISDVGEDCQKDCWKIFCTREQFESFVESLFEGAPEGATHYSPACKINKEVWWKKDGDEMHCICEAGRIYDWTNGYFDETVQLISRPAKKAPVIGDTPEQLKEGVKPEAPYIPKVAEVCELILSDGEWHEISVIFVGRETIVFELDGVERVEHKNHKLFRPLRTERELFIEKATAAYLKQVGSDAVDKKWFGRIFGALYDAGYTKNNTKKEEN